MNKVIEDGKVAVLYSPGHGAGWYTWHGVEELLYDPVIVKMVLENVDYSAIEEYCEKTYGGNHYYGGADRLDVTWVPQGQKFIINEYDGYETVVYDEHMEWIVP